MKPFKTYRNAAKWLRSHSNGATTVLISTETPTVQLSSEDRRLGRFFLPSLWIPLGELLEVL